eukprot:SM000051S17527  [mRNA]  locus=s51:46298:47302:- [translate_table: standard]
MAGARPAGRASGTAARSGTESRRAAESAGRRRGAGPSRGGAAAGQHPAAAAADAGERPGQGGGARPEHRRDRPPRADSAHCTHCYASSIVIDVLEVEGKYYGFSGCHRYEAHQRLGLPTIKCRARQATRDVLRMHMR